MPNRRDFLRGVAGATAGMMITGGGFADALARPPQEGAAKRREVTIAGRRVKVVDVHAHCVIPEVAGVVKGTNLEKFARTGGPRGGGEILGPERLRVLDQRGIDVQLIGMDGFWWYNAADRDLASKIAQVQTDGIAAGCSAHSDRLVGLVPVTLQFPDLAAEQLEHAMKRQNFRGAEIGGNVAGEPLSASKYDPFWAKAEELGAFIFVHPTSAENIVKEGELSGSGDLGNIIGNPFETSVLFSHLIFDGTLDRFPGLKICGAHAGGYLPSYLGRIDQTCDVRPRADCKNKKKPREYFHQQLMADSLIFTEEGLRHMVAEMGPSQVLYGTDIPFKWPDSVDLILQSPDLKDAEKEAILGGNLAKLLKLS